MKIKNIGYIDGDEFIERIEESIASIKRLRKIAKYPAEQKTVLKTLKMVLAQARRCQ